MTPDLAQMFGKVMQGLGQQPAGLSPWAIRKDCLAQSVQTLRAVRDETAAPSPSANRRGQSLAGNTFATRLGNVAVVPVIGPLMARMSRAYWSYDEIVRDLQLAETAPDIDAVILDIDSPGGMVSNVDAVPQQIGRMSKPVVAHVGGIGASAAYWIATAAGRVVADRTALVGSVGALIRYVDLEGVLTRLGANVVEVIAEQSPAKRLDPDSDEGRAELQAIVDAGAEMFIETLTRQRAVDRATILERYGQGLVFTAADALDRGMIDGVMSFEEVLADLVDRPEGDSDAETTAAQATEAMSMANGREKGAAATEPAAAAPTTEASLRAEHPELVQAIEQAAASAAANAERDRIAGIDKAAGGLTGVADLVAEMKADGKTTPVEAGARLLEATKSTIAERMKGLEKLDKAAEGIESSPSATGVENDDPGPAADTPEGWKAEWEKSAALQAEFRSCDAYVAYMKAKAAGKIRVFGAKG